MTTQTTLNVPLVDLRASYLPVKEQILTEFENIFDKMHLFLGENIRNFEQEFTNYCKAHAGLACSNGTDALTLALKAFDFPCGFEAIVPSHTFFATVESVHHAGGTPVMIDIDPDTYCMDPNRIEDAISEKTKVIVPVHIYGQCADMDAIKTIAQKHNLHVIEDAAQAHGSFYKGQTAGSLADAAAFSFYFTKNLGAFGETGFCTAATDDVFNRMQLLRHHGHSGKFDHDIIGYNFRPDELQAAILRAKLPHLDDNNRKRRDIAAQYDAAFANLDIKTPIVAEHNIPNYHCYVIQTPNRDDLVAHLGKHNIGTGIHYKNPVHVQPAVQTIAHRAMPMPVTESVCANCVTLPCYPELTSDQVTHVIDAVRSFF